MARDARPGSGPVRLHAPASPRIRVLLADDQALVRRGVRLPLDGDEALDVVGEGVDIRNAAGEVRARLPTVLVADLTLPEALNVEAIGRVRQEAPEVRIVVLAGDDDPVFAAEALAAGAVGYVLKDHAGDELGEAVRRAARGERHVSARVEARLRALERGMRDDALTTRELEILRLIALGHTSTEIARALHLSARTVETYRARIHRKLGLSSRADLVRYALRLGLVAG